MHIVNYWSIANSSWQVFGKDVYDLKVIFDRLLGHSAQKKRLFTTHLPIYLPLYAHMALGNCKNFRDFNFANISREILYVYGM